MSSPEQATAPNYPKDQSMIVIGPIESGMIDTAFRYGMQDHSSDGQLSWHSYGSDDTEVFTVRRFGDSIRTPAETDWYQMSIWVLEFETRKKSLLIDGGDAKVFRLEDEFVLPASNQDISDLVAAYHNLHALNDEKHKQS